MSAENPRDRAPGWPAHYTPPQVAPDADALRRERDALRAAMREILGMTNELSWDRKARTIAGRIELIARAALAANPPAGGVREE